MNRNQIVNEIVSKIDNGIFVEIGTHEGHFADYILSNSNNSILYCIDPYIKYDNYEDAINNITGDILYENVYKRLENKYGKRVIFIRKLSTDAVDLIPNNIDFLYIDGNHKYTYVYKDLELYYPKVKSNCYIIGDDAVDVDESKRNENGDVYIEWGGSHCYGQYGVIKAFNEFILKEKIEGQIIGNQYVIKKL